MSYNSALPHVSLSTMCLDILVLVGLSLSPYEFFHSLVFHRKKNKLLDEFLSHGEDIEGTIHSQRRWELRYGGFREKRTTIQYSYSLLNETLKREATLPCHLSRTTTTVALKVLPEQYPKSACPVLFLQRQKQDLSLKLPIACRSFLALVGVNVATCLMLALVVNVARESNNPNMASLIAIYPIPSYLLILILYTSLGYPCALVEFRRWKQCLISDQRHDGTEGAEYQLVKQSCGASVDESAPKKTKTIVQEISHLNLSLDQVEDESNEDKKGETRMASSKENEEIVGIIM